MLLGDLPQWGELAATGVSVRRRDPSTVDELTAQELQISYKALLYKLKQIGCEEYGA